MFQEDDNVEEGDGDGEGNPVMRNGNRLGSMEHLVNSEKRVLFLKMQETLETCVRSGP